MLLRTWLLATALFAVSNGLPSYAGNMNKRMFSNHALEKRAVIRTDLLWPTGSEITFGFVDPSRLGLSPQGIYTFCSESLQSKVRQIAPLWLQAANLTLTELTSDPIQASITIICIGGYTSSSVAGMSSTRTKPSMRLARRDGLDERLTQMLILHEFGHALGLMHEHQSPNVPKKIECHPRDPECQINLGTFERSENVVASPLDRFSVMMYDLEHGEIGDFDPHANWKLSYKDLMYIGAQYPYYTYPCGALECSSMLKLPNNGECEQGARLINLKDGTPLCFQDIHPHLQSEAGYSNLLFVKGTQVMSVMASGYVSSSGIEHLFSYYYYPVSRVSRQMAPEELFTISPNNTLISRSGQAISTFGEYFEGPKSVMVALGGNFNLKLKDGMLVATDLPYEDLCVFANDKGMLVLNSKEQNNPCIDSFVLV